MCDAQKTSVLKLPINDDGGGSENVAEKKNSSLQNVSRLFGPAQFVKCRRSFLELNT